MKSITIHKLDDELNGELTERAERTGTSLNQTIKRLLRRAVGLDEANTSHRADFEDLFGTWSTAEAEVFDSRVRDLGEIDESEW